MLSDPEALRQRRSFLPALSNAKKIKTKKKRTFSAQRLSLGDLAHEVGLLLLQVGWETLVLGLRDSLLDDFSLLGTLSFNFLLDRSSQSSVIPLQGPSKLGIRLPLVVEVDGVGWRQCQHNANERP